ncbi:hypothetical protein J6590_021164 [Homalodisca vitripennis]|nr:hypothetical protein J6590_021164 [Homalodisca vitripennis]
MRRHSRQSVNYRLAHYRAKTSRNRGDSALEQTRVDNTPVEFINLQIRRFGFERFLVFLPFSLVSCADNSSTERAGAGVKEAGHGQLTAEMRFVDASSGYAINQDNKQPAQRPY